MSCFPSSAGECVWMFLDNGDIMTVSYCVERGFNLFTSHSQSLFISVILTLLAQCVACLAYVRQVTVPPPTNADGTGGTGPDVQKTILHSVFGVAAPGQMVALMGMRCVSGSMVMHAPETSILICLSNVLFVDRNTFHSGF